MKEELKIGLSTKLDEIAHEIKLYDFENSNDLGYIGGLSGIMSFLFDYGRFKNDEECIELGVSYIHTIAEKFGKIEPHGHFYMSLAGFGTQLEYLKEKEIVDAVDVLHPHNKTLANIMLHLLKHNNWDLLHGAIGISLYLFKQLNNKYVRDSLEQMVDWFHQNLTKDPKGYKWDCLDLRYSINVFNLGLAHGMPCIMVFFVKCIEHNINKELATDLLNNLVSFFLSNKTHDKDFVYRNTVDGDDTGPRLAWCYGDLGVVIALNIVHELQGGLQQELDELVDSIVTRRTPENSGIVDGSFCHGTAGVLYIYKYLQTKNFTQITQDDLSFWARKSLEIANNPEGVAGFGKFVMSEDRSLNRYEKDYGILTGIAGIGNIFMSILNDDLSWSENLLIY